MFEHIETTPVIDVEESEYRRLLGYPPDFESEARSRKLSAWARAWYAENGRPWFYLRETALELADRHFALDGAEFSMSRLKKQLTRTGAHTAFVAVVSAGRECEAHAHELWTEGKPDEYFFLEIFGSAVVEHLTALAAIRMCSWAEDRGLLALPHYSPGYSGWNIADQNRLFATIVDGREGSFPGPLDVAESGMLIPKKSLIAVYGVTRHHDRVGVGDQLTACESCSMRACDYRRAPYRFDLAGLSAKAAPPSTNGSAEPEHPLTKDAPYSLNSRTLRKWSAERLQVDILDDNSVEARFRYDGTTCSNMGRPLSYDYFVKLSPASAGHVVEEAACRPAPDDEGHKFQCAYLSSPETFPELIAREHPLLGKPLDELLSWERDTRMTGCYCDRKSRRHKWSNVFEVIHYALAQRDPSHPIGTNKTPDIQTSHIEV